MKKICIIYNPASGSSGSKQDITAAFDGSGLSLDFVRLSDRLANDVRQAKQQGSEVLVAAGGDGTVNAVAGLAVKLNVPMAVLPLGTLNHFAKDIGIPQDLASAAGVISKGRLQKLDYCSVNDNIFVNNSSIGLYPVTVLQRQKWESKIGTWPAAFVATLRATFSISTTHLKLDINDTERTFKTPLVFVGNNSYQFDSVGFTNRERLDGGILYLYVVRADRARALIRLAVLAFFGKRWKRDDFLAESRHEITINSRKSVLDVAVDGEVLALNPPLVYKTHPAQLTVCTPK